MKIFIDPCWYVENMLGLVEAQHEFINLYKFITMGNIVFVVRTTPSFLSWSVNSLRIILLKVMSYVLSTFAQDS